MFVPFAELAGHSRVWIYQSSRKFNSADLIIISDMLSAFSQEWNAHGVALRSSFQIRYDQFIIVAADETYNGASGCSIDSSTRTIKELGQQLEVDLFDRTQVGFRKGDDVILLKMTELKNKFQDGSWNDQTLVFNNLVSTKNELDSGWLVPAGSTWLKRYTGHVTVAG